MKLGIIFKKEFRGKSDIWNNPFGDKVEYHGDEINIKRETDWKFNEVLIIKIKHKKGETFDETIESFLVSTIQLIYFGGWKD